MTYIGDVPGGSRRRPLAGADGFERLQHALGLGGRSRATPSARRARGLEGVIDYLRPIFIGVRTSDALYRFFGRNAFGHPVGMSIHMFVAVRTPRAKREWAGWLAAAYDS